MPIGFAEARLAARQAVPHLYDGMTATLAKELMAMDHPDMNGFERNRALSRAQAIVSLETLIRAGTPPATITLPYPLPPSSVGPNPPPNEVDVDMTVLRSRPGHSDEYRIARTEGVSGNAWLDYLIDLDRILAEWQADSGIVGTVVVNFARSIL